MLTIHVNTHAGSNANENCSGHPDFIIIISDYWYYA